MVRSPRSTCRAAQSVSLARGPPGVEPRRARGENRALERARARRLSGRRRPSLAPRTAADLLRVAPRPASAPSARAGAAAARRPGRRPRRRARCGRPRAGSGSRRSRRRPAGRLSAASGSVAGRSGASARAQRSPMPRRACSLGVPRPTPSPRPRVVGAHAWPTGAPRPRIAPWPRRARTRSRGAGGCRLVEPARELARRHVGPCSGRAPAESPTTGRDGQRHAAALPGATDARAPHVAGRPCARAARRPAPATATRPAPHRCRCRCR